MGKGVGGNVSIEREVVTDAGNRIDILIESDDHAILVENKIFAGIGNPFPDYAAHLDRRTPDGRSKHKLLLTLSPMDEGRAWDFTNLTYADFVRQIRSLMGHYFSRADTRYLTMLLDFLNTLENLQRETHMDKEFVSLLAERGDDAGNFFAEVMSFKDELRKKVRELSNLISAEEYGNVRQYFYRERTGLYDDLVHDVRVSEDLLVATDTVVDARGWRIFIWPREGIRSEVAALLESLEITFEAGNLLIPSTQDKRFVHSTRFGYSENLDRIRPVLHDLIHRIATSRNATSDPTRR